MSKNIDLMQKVRKTLEGNLQSKFEEYIEECKKNGKKVTEIYADIANILDVSEDAVSKWNYGRQLPGKIEHFFLLCSIFGCSIDELFKGIDFSAKELKEYKELGMTKKIMKNVIDLYKDDNIKTRLKLESTQKKMNQLVETVVEKNNIKSIEPKVLFGSNNVFKKPQYIDMLSYIVMKDIINSSLVNYYNFYRNKISNEIIKLYNLDGFVDNLKKEEKDKNKIKEKKNKEARNSIKKYLDKIEFNKYGKNPLNSDIIRNPDVTKVIYNNLINNLSSDERIELEELDGILKDEISNFVYNFVIDMLFQLNDENSENTF